MNPLLLGFLIVVSFLVIYWFLFAQRRYNEILNPPKQYELKAILFDMDGTLLDSFDCWHCVVNEAGKKYGLKPITKEWFKKHIWGGSLENDSKKYFKGHDSEKIGKEYTKLKKKYAAKLRLMDGAENLLKEIKKRKLKIGLVTNTSGIPVMDSLKQHKIEKYFDVIVTADDVENHKPHPEPLWRTCEELGVVPKEIVYVGDTKNDFKAARAAGIYMVGLNTHANIIIDKLEAMIPLLPEVKKTKKKKK